MNDEALKVLNRVKKLLALANDAAATEGERDNALRMANNTLAKHQLTMAQVGALDNDSQDPRINQVLDLHTDEAWTATVCTGIAEVFFCKNFRDTGYYDPNKGYRTVQQFIGKAVNVQTAIYMAEYIISSIVKEADKAAATYFGNIKLASILGIADETPEATKKVWKDSFKVGAAQAFRRKCIELVKANKENDAQGTGTSLVLRSLYERELDLNLAFIKAQMGVDLRPFSSGMKQLAQGAAAKGREYGSSLNVHRPIGGATGTIKLGVKK